MRKLHKYGCRCCSCKSKRGEYKGINHHRWIRRETRTCIVPECNNIFECRVDSVQKYCSHKCWLKSEDYYEVCVNRKFSKETREKMRKAQEGKRHSEATKKKIRKSKEGRQFTLREIRVCEYEECNNIFKVIITSPKRYCCIACASRNISEETRKKMSLTLTGRTKENHPGVAAGAAKRRGQTKETHPGRAAQAAKLRGRKLSKEIRKNMSIASKKRWQDPEFVKKVRAKSFPNKPEILLLDILNTLFPNEYKFVGDGEFTLAGKNPDFVNVNGQKKIIELFGDYWHGEDVQGVPKEQHMQERIDCFAQYGYQTLIIWEHELENIEQLKKRVLLFSV